MANVQNVEVTVQIGPRGMGRIQVPYAPGVIELLKVLEDHGVPHAKQCVDPTKAWIEVLGAIPDSEVTVVFYTEAP
jgi:hypothetical protein